MPKVLRYCLLCESEWIGGHETPGHPMKEGLRSFYECGASISYQEPSPGVYKFIVKNCGEEDA